MTAWADPLDTTSTAINAAQAAQPPGTSPDPPDPHGPPRVSTLVRARPADLASWRREAEGLGVSLNGWIVNQLNRAVDLAEYDRLVEEGSRDAE